MITYVTFSFSECSRGRIDRITFLNEQFRVQWTKLGCGLVLAVEVSRLAFSSYGRRETWSPRRDSNSFGCGGVAVETRARAPAAARGGPTFASGDNRNVCYLSICVPMRELTEDYCPCICNNVTRQHLNPFLNQNVFKRKVGSLIKDMNIAVFFSSFVSLISSLKIIYIQSNCYQNTIWLLPYH